MIINIRIFLDYFIMIIFIAISGVPYLSSPQLNALLFSLLFLIFMLRKMIINLSFFLFFVTVFAVTLLQALDFAFYPIITNMGIYILVFNAYLIVKILENKFIFYYINIMYYIAIVSLVFYFSILLIPSLGYYLVHSIVPLFTVFNLANSVHETVIIYNLSHIDIFRNSGPFWEPGAFAGYLVIAFMFNLVRVKKIGTKKNILMLVTILTTLSTTAYLVTFIFLSFVYYKQIKNILLKSISVTTIIVIAIGSYVTFDFIGAKIEARLDDLKKVNILETGNSGRFVSVLRDMKDFNGHEFTGTGRNTVTRYNSSSPNERLVIRSNGLSDVIVENGLILFTIIVYFLYKSICAYVSIISLEQSHLLICIAIFISVLMLLLSEAYFNYPIYWSLLFLQYVYYEKEKKDLV